MNTQTQENEQRVIEALISNLRSTRRGALWTRENILIQEYTAHMNDPVRKYHTWNHLAHMLDELDEFGAHNTQQALRLRASILFHDIVCVPGSPDDEEQSVEYAGKFYSGTNLSEVADLIMATKHIFPFEKYGDDRDLICDLDLTILGAPRDEFLEYRLKVSQEYKDYCTPEEFDSGTVEFFRKLHDQATRDYIFRTEYFRNKYEEKARENIKSMLGM